MASPIQDRAWQNYLVTLCYYGPSPQIQKKHFQILTRILHLENTACVESRRRIQLTEFKIEFSVVEDFVDGENWNLPLLVSKANQDGVEIISVLSSPWQDTS